MSATAQKHNDYRSLTGPEKAAMLILSLGEEYSIKLFQQMEEDEIREISQVMSSLGGISAEFVEKLFVEFVEQFNNVGSLVGSFENTERLLARVMDGDRVSTIMEDIRGPAGRTMWDKLNNVNESILANYMKNEYPQTVAVVMSKIAPEHAARVLAILPESFAMEVVQRMLKMESVQKDVLNDIEKTLRSEFMSNLARTSRRDPHAMMAEIFNGLDRSTEQRFIATLEENDDEAADKIKSLMFTFDDMNRLDGTGIQVILKTVDKSKLALALKGANAGIKELFLGNMSERAAKILREDIDTLGAVKLKDVEESQGYLIRLTKNLADKGEIEINDGKGGDELVY